MGEIEPQLVEADAAPLLPGPLADQAPRTHALTLCCANSVEGIVGEVGRALEGLGFETEVVTGSDARSAILDRGGARDRPTIYVVCVQGALKDTVVGPLRQALATHGGPDEHLFVAVLDLSLPLSMVGQVRRFAEALERMPGGTRPDPLHERRQWREHSGSRVIDENDTSTYRAVKRDQVRKRSAKSKASPPITPPHRVARIEPTRKYRAVTGPLPAVPGEFDGDEMPTVARSTRGDAPKTHRKRVRVPSLDPHAVPQETERAVVAANFGAAIAEPPRRRGGAWVLLVLVLVGGAAFASYQLGAYDRFLPTDMQATAIAAAGGEQNEDAPADAPGAADEPETAGEHVDSPSDEKPSAAAANPNPKADLGAPDPAGVVLVEDAAEEDDAEDEAVAGDPAPDAPQDGSEPAAVADSASNPVDAEDELEADPAPDEPEPEPQPEPQPVPVEPPAPVASAEADLSPPSSAEVETKLARAIERRAVKVSNKYYTATTDPPKARWDGARRLCRVLEIDGVDDWRLPHRRELQLLGAIGMLAKGSFWSRTVDTDDTDFAYVYERSGRRLSSWEKSEPATVICVRKRS